MPLFIGLLGLSAWNVKQPVYKITKISVVKNSVLRDKEAEIYRTKCY